MASNQREKGHHFTKNQLLKHVIRLFGHPNRPTRKQSSGNTTRPIVIEKL